MGEDEEDLMRFALQLAVFLAIAALAYPAVSVSSDIIDCCGQWNADVEVLSDAGAPVISCPVRTAVLVDDGGVVKSISDATYFTNSKGLASVAYKPGSAAEKYRVSVNCGGVRFEQTIPVVGSEGGGGFTLPSIPGLNLSLDLGTVDWLGVGAAVFGGLFLLVIAAVLYAKGGAILGAIRELGTGKRAVDEGETSLEDEMAPKHYILEHERKFMEARRLARKHMRKEVRLSHDYMKRFD